MSRWTDPAIRAASRSRRTTMARALRKVKHAEAECRNAVTSPERRRSWRRQASSVAS